MRAEYQKEDGHERISISVEDTGIGMTTKALTNLQRLLGDEGEEEMIMQQATGIGLNIINRIANQICNEEGGIKVKSVEK